MVMEQRKGVIKNSQTCFQNKTPKLGRREKQTQKATVGGKLDFVQISSKQIVMIKLLESIGLCIGLCDFLDIFFFTPLSPIHSVVFA